MSTQMPREIAFEDIRAGDRLWVKQVEDGIEFTREGVAHRNAYHGWFTSEGGLLVAAEFTATITLLHRPVAAEPKGLGAVVRAKVVYRSLDRTLVRALVRTANRDFPWAAEGGTRWEWSDFDPESIEVLSEGLLEVGS